MNLVDLVRFPRWSPRGAFPPSQELSPRVFALGEGFYLMTNPVRGEGDPVRAVGWAQSDYWARRVWDNPPFAGDLQAPPAQWEEPPSLEFLGRPARLSYKEVRAFERSKGDTLESGNYRLTDGALLSIEVTGIGDVCYHFASTRPKAGDLPVAIEIGLPA